MRTEVHYGVLTSSKTGTERGITDYETDGESATRDAARARPDWPFTTELVTRKVQVGVWRYAYTNCVVHNPEGEAGGSQERRGETEATEQTREGTDRRDRDGRWGCGDHRPGAFESDRSQGGGVRGVV